MEEEISEVGSFWKDWEMGCGGERGGGEEEPR